MDVSFFVCVGNEEAIEEAFQKARRIVVLDHSHCNQLIEHDRLGHLKKVKADYLIAKNRLLKLALKDWNAEALTHLEESLNNPTATLFAYSDEMSAVKTLADFIKTHHLPKIKMGFLGKELGKIGRDLKSSRLSNLAN